MNVNKRKATLRQVCTCESMELLANRQLIVTAICIFTLQWVICDARHDSTCNAYHTTVPCLMGTTHRIAAVQTLSRETHRVAQTREVDATLLVLEQAKDRGIYKYEITIIYA